MDFNSFLTSLGTSFLIFLLLMLLFALLSGRPGNHVVYYPNRILKGLDPWEPRSGARNPFSWIREAISSTQEDILHISGVDTATYFVFLATVLRMLVLCGIILLPLLLPIAATDDGLKANTTSAKTSSKETFNVFDKLSMANIQENSPRLWAFLLCAYWVSFVAYFELWRAYKHVSLLRGNAIMSPEVRPEQFVILVRDMPHVPQGHTGKEQVELYFRSIYPDTFYRSMAVTNNKEVDEVWEKLQGCKKKLARAEAIFEKSKESGTEEGTRPTNRIGFLGLIGEKVDSIEYYKKKINELTRNLEAEQTATLQEKQGCSALVFLTSRLVAACAAQSLHALMVDTWSVSEAPELRQIIWSNLHIKFFERQIRKYIVYLIVFLIILFYMIPIGFISAFTTLDNLRKLLPFLEPVLDKAAIKTVLEAYLPQLALMIFLSVLPKLLLFLSKSEGIPSQSHVERAASGKYFYFTVLNVFIGVTIGGTLFGMMKTIEENPNSIISLLARSLPQNATFFLTYVALKFFVGYGLELSRIVPLIIFHLKKKYLCKIEEDKKEAWFPGDLGYATRVPADMLIVTIVLCYSVITPIIILFGVLYFGLGWLILRNQALKVYVPSYESYGRMWPHMHSRVVAALLLFQVTMLGYFGIMRFSCTALLIPLPLLSLVFAFICKKKFYRAFCHTPLEVACHDLKRGSPNMEQICRSYIPPSLRSDELDDDDLEDVSL